MNNYNFWPIEDLMIGHPVYFMDIYDLKRFPDSLKTPIGYIGYRYDSSFNSFARIRFNPEKNNYSVDQNDSVLIRGTFEMSRWYWGYFSDHHLPPTSFKLFVFKKRTVIKEIIIPANLNKPSDSITFFLKPSLKAGSYKCIFSIEVEGYNPTHNSDPIKLTVH